MDQLMLRGMHLIQVPAQSIVRSGIKTLLHFNSFHNTHIYVSYDRGEGGAELNMSCGSMVCFESVLSAWRL